VPVLGGSPNVDGVITFDKFAYDRPLDALRPGKLLAALRFAYTLRGEYFDTVVILHHLTTRWGALKYAALAFATGARRRIGLDNGRGWFLTHRARDGGFGWRHEVEYALDVVGCLGAQTGDTRLEVPTSASDTAFAEQMLPVDGRGPLVAIHPGSGGWSLARRWQADGFAAVADALAERYDARIVLVGASGDGVGEVASQLKAQALNLEGRTTVGQLAAVLRRCDLFIGADSGVMHIAAAAGTPTVAIFGPTNPAAWGPWLLPERRRIVRSAPLCSPCAYTDAGLGEPQGCPERTSMRTVTAQQVLDAAEGLLSGRKLDDIDWRPELPVVPPNMQPLGDDLTLDQALDCVEAFVAEGRPRLVVFVDADSIAMAQRDAILSLILRRAALRLAVDPSVVWAARRLGGPVRTVFDPVEVIERLAARGAAAGWRLFVLGWTPGLAEVVAGALAERHPGLLIAGTHTGSPAGEEEDAIVALIRQARPTLLLVGFGISEQEKWLARNLPRLGVPVSLGVGAALEHIAGRPTAYAVNASWRTRLRRLRILVKLAASAWLSGR
jgi:heptosyltransferase-2